MKNMIRKKEKY